MLSCKLGRQGCGGLKYRVRRQDLELVRRRIVVGRIYCIEQVCCRHASVRMNSHISPTILGVSTFDGYSEARLGRVIEKLDAYSRV